MNMNNSIIDTDALLEELNNEKTVLMIPVIVILVLLMITGLIGNAMVCFYYGFKTKHTTSSIFIVVLAVFDIITCSIAVPIEIVDLRFFYKFENGAACKVMRFVNHFASIGSVATLLAISIDRYRRICRPFNRQLKLKHAKIASAVAVGLAILLSWPACVFYTAVKVNVKNDFGIEISGTDCTTTKEQAYRVTLWIFNGIHLVLFIASVLILVVLYSKVERVIYVHSKYREKYNITSPVKSSMEADQVATDSSDLSDDKTSRDFAQPTTDAVTSNTNCKRESFELSENTRNPKNATVKSPHLKTIKYTMIMLVITIVFIVSFLPYLCLVIWRIFLGKYEADVLSDSELVAFQIGIRSYMLNSGINPITYGFFNSKFRTFFYTILCPCLARARRQFSVSSSGT